MQVTLELANQSAQMMQTIKHFFLGYFYDMAQYDDNIIMNEAGLPTWKPDGLPGPQTTNEFVVANWWIRDDCQHYLVRADGIPAGFVMICAEKKHLPTDIDYEMLAFYITPKYRRQGVGHRAALQALDLYHGRWVVYELERNLPARTFWQAILGEYTHGNFEDLDNGTEQRFRN